MSFEESINLINYYCRGCFKQLKNKGSCNLQFCDGYCYNKYAVKILNDNKFKFF